MCTNFDFLKKQKEFEPFADSAIEAEKSLMISSATSSILTRRALELSVKWLYSFDSELTVPYQENLMSLIHENSFKRILEPRLFPMLKYIVQLGNSAVHSTAFISRDDAVLSLRNLFEFTKWIEYCYADHYEDTQYDETLLPVSEERKRRPEELKDLYEKLSAKDKKLEEARKENEELQLLMSRMKEQNQKQRAFTVDSLSEAKTRQKYIDLELRLAGWHINQDCLEEVQVTGMPNPTGIGYVDYVLYGDNGKPLAVVEAKKTSVKPAVGSQQAKLYADCLQNQYYQRPLIFTTNGYEIFYTDDSRGYPVRRVSGFFTKDELQLEVDRRTTCKILDKIEIKDAISNRYYQKEAITAVCDAINHKQRKMLLVMATGSGKTRTAISIVDVLGKYNYVKNVLFLADRTALVTQAKRNFNNLMPNLSLCNLLDGKDNPEQARMIFSTYPTMMNAIDETKSEFGERLFTPGHFDLIIVDESHRSIYKKYRDIFDYFDAMVVGLTATPKDEVDKNTYAMFELENKVPTFAYELSKAVEDGYLVDYTTIEVKSKIMETGIHYDDLSEEEKEEFEKTFEDDENIKDSVSSSAVNEWLFNTDTINRVLSELMEKGLKIEGNDKLGKTIIFAKNSRHAEDIVERFQKRYPEYGPHFIKQIDYSIKYADTLIDDFGTKDKYPQIAVSVDMLDTGIDVPEILNLVFFKKVRSYAKFWQMIGRGTRLCKDLLGPGIDKEKFLIFDFCGNFDFFRVDPKGSETGIGESLTEKLFVIKALIARELQDTSFSEKEYQEYRNQLVDGLVKEVQTLKDDSFRVKLHLRQVETYKDRKSWDVIDTNSMSEIRKDIAPLILPTEGDELAKRFDYVIYSIHLAMLQSKDATKAVRTVIQTAEKLEKVTDARVKAQKHMIEVVQTEEFWQNTDIFQLEKVRKALRDLICLIEKINQKIYYTNFTDEILELKEGTSFYNANNLKDYKKKVEFFLKQHEEVLAIYKLRNNKKMTESDLKELEHILWQELGTKTDYEKEYGNTPVGRLVRKIVGLDRKALNEAFSEFLTDEHLNVNQIRFVRLIVDYVEKNGMIEDKSVLMQEPFRSVGSIVTLFQDNMDVAKKIMGVVDQINKNSEEIA